MQVAYVLCRLFRKSEEKAQVLKDDDFEPISSSPMAKSSPGETSSDLVPETPASGMEMNGQSEAIKQWLTDGLDDMTTNACIHVESCSNSCMMFDLENYATVGPSFEVILYFSFFLGKT